MRTGAAFIPAQTFKTDYQEGRPGKEQKSFEQTRVEQAAANKKPHAGRKNGTANKTGNPAGASPSPDFMKDKKVRAALNKAWVDSDPNAKAVARGQPGSKKHEQGGWIVKRPDGHYDVVRVPPGTRDGLGTIVGTRPNGNVVGWFHTHPNTQKEGYLDTPGPADIAFTRMYAKVPGVVMTHSGVKFIPHP